MHIWLITIGEPLTLESDSKIRTMLLADKLIARGHSVTLFASALDHFKKIWVYENDIRIKQGSNYEWIVIKGTGYEKNISIRRFVDHRIIARKFRKMTALKANDALQKPDIIVVSSPPHDLAFNAVRYAKKNNVPVLVDVRDEWPELFLSYVPRILQPVFRVLFWYEFYQFKYAMRNATGIISMMSSLLEWSLKYAGRKKGNNDSLFYLGGKKNESLETSVSDFTTRFNIPNNKFIVAFIGTFVNNNDPSVIIECARLLKLENIHFILAGDGELLSGIREKAKQMPSITLTGWLNRDEISSLLALAKVGVCPASRYRDAFPNKAFTYLSKGIPVLTSFQGDLKDYIERNNFGFYYPPDDAKELAACILRLQQNPELYKTQSENARKIFSEVFDAENIYESFTLHVEAVAKNYRK